MLPIEARLNSVVFRTYIYERFFFFPYGFVTVFFTAMATNWFRYLFTVFEPTIAPLEAELHSL